MRTGALVTGIIGGVFGIIASLIFLMAGSAFSSGSAQGRGGLGLLFSILGVVGAALVTRRPVWATVLLAVATVGTLLSIGLFGILTFPLFLVGAILAFVSRNEPARQSTPAGYPPA